MQGAYDWTDTPIKQKITVCLAHSYVDLVSLREAAGLTARGLARELGITHAAVLKWERAGKVAKTEFLIPMSRILGVTIEELLGQPKPRKSAAPAGGKLGQVFREVSELPRSQQEKVIAILEPFVSAHTKA